MEYSVEDQETRQRVDVKWKCNNCGCSQSRIGIVGEGSLNISCKECKYSFGRVNLSHGSWKKDLNKIKERQESRSQEEIRDVASVLRYRHVISFITFSIGVSAIVLTLLALQIFESILGGALLGLGIFVMQFVTIYVHSVVIPSLAGWKSDVSRQTVYQIRGEKY